MASSRIKGITIEIDGNTTKLQNALKAVEKQISTTKNSLRDVDKLLKFDPGNSELLTQKQKYLSEAIDGTKEKLRQEQEALAQLKNAPATEETIKQQEALEREILDTKQALQGLTEEYRNFGSVSAQQIANVGQNMKQVGDKMSAAGSTLTRTVTAPIIGLGAAAVKTVAEFDTGMSQVKAVSGATGEEFAQLREKAREMGASTKFSASEAAEAMNYMAMAGWKAGQMISGIDGVMNLAAASGSDLATTSDILTDALTAFGMSAEEAGHFADTLAAASSNANTNVEMMGETFKYAASVAGSMGYTADDTALAIGAMANSGIKASQAGTSLRSILTRMAAPTDKVANAMTTLGIKLTDAQGNIRPLRDVMEDLRKSFNVGNLNMEEYTKKLNDLNEQAKNGEIVIGSYEQAVMDLEESLESGAISSSDYDKKLEEIDRQLAIGELQIGDYQEKMDELTVSMFGAAGAQKAQIANDLAGKNAMTGLLAIIGASEEDWNKLADAIDHSSDELAQLADGSIVPLNEALESGQEIMATYSGRAAAMAGEMQDNLEGQLTILKSQLQELAISFGDLLMPTIRDVVGKIQEFVDKLNSMDEGTKQTIIKIALVAAAFGPLLLVLGKLTSAIGSILTLAPQITSAISSLSGAMSGAAGSTGMLSGAMGALPIAAVVAELGILTAALVTAYQTDDEFKATVDENWAAIKESCAEMRAAFEEMGGGIVEALNNLGFSFESFGDLVKTSWEGISSLIANNQIGPILQKVTETIQLFSNECELVFGTLGALLKGEWSEAWQMFKSAVAGILEWLVKSVADKIPIVGGYIRQLIEQLKEIKSVEQQASAAAGGAQRRSSNKKIFASAMNHGVILSKPTIFGAQNGKYLQAGEAGDEVVVGANSLSSMIRASVPQTDMSQLSSVISDAVGMALQQYGITLEVEANQDGIFNSVVQSNSVYKKMHGGVGALA